MNASALIDRLDAFRSTLPGAVAGVSAEDARWRPDPSHWSVLEILGHLLDSETDDFPVRLFRTLEDPARAWDPIDPEGAVVERRHNDRDIDTLVEAITTRRSDWVNRLRALRDVDWSVAHQHASLGVLRAGDLLAAWTAHDALHVRQIAKRRFQLTVRDADGYSTDYAGQWTS